MQIIAEGIESPKQLESLSTLRCATGQGFYFAPPLTAGQFEMLLAAQPERTRR